MRRLLIVLLAAGACHGKRAGKDYFGTQVSPPGILAQIRPEMTVAQVKAIAPDAKDDPGKGLLLATPASNAKLYAITDGDLVSYTYVDYAGDDGMAVLTQAWGPPDKEPDRSDLHNTAWRSTATGWRANVFCGNGTAEVKLPPFCTIEFHPHLPIDNMFGKAIAPPGALAKVTPRMPLAQLKATTHLAALTDKPTQSLNRWLDYDGAVEGLGVVDGRLYSLDYTLPEVARPVIEKAWGPPAAEGDRSIWFDANTGWSATLEKSEPHELRLELQGYQPFASEVELLESIVAAPSIDDAKKAHPELDWEVEKQADRSLPLVYVSCNELTDPVFRAARFTIISLFPDTRGTRAILGNLDPAKEATIVDALTKKWGAPVKSVRDGETEYRFAHHGVLVVLASSITLQFGADV